MGKPVRVQLPPSAPSFLFFFNALLESVFSAATIRADFLSDPVRLLPHRRIHGRDLSAVPLSDHSPIRMSHLGRNPHRIFPRRQKKTRISVASLTGVPVGDPSLSENGLPVPHDGRVIVPWLSCDWIGEDPSSRKKGVFLLGIESLPRRVQKLDFTHSGLRFCLLGHVSDTARSRTQIWHTRNQSRFGTLQEAQYLNLSQRRYELFFCGLPFSMFLSLSDLHSSTWFRREWAGYHHHSPTRDSNFVSQELKRGHFSRIFPNTNSFSYCNAGRSLLETIRECLKSF